MKVDLSLPYCYLTFSPSATVVIYFYRHRCVLRRHKGCESDGNYSTVFGKQVSERGGECFRRKRNGKVGKTLSNFELLFSAMRLMDLRFLSACDIVECEEKERGIVLTAASKSAV